MSRISRHCRFPRLVDEAPDAVDVVHLSRHQHLEIVCEADQATVKHPMCGAGQSNSVADDVGPVVLDRLNVSCLDLGSTTAMRSPR